jgi:hypothetical protein
VNAWQMMSLIASALGVLGAALLGITLYVCGRAVASVAVDELKGWLPHMAAALVTAAAARLPALDRDRYREEWLAELLAYQDRAFTAFIYSVRVRSRARSLANELPASDTPEMEPAITSAPPVPRWHDDRMLDREFGQALRMAREAAGLTTEQLARLLCYSPRTIHRYMAGERRPDRMTVERWETTCRARQGSLVEIWEGLSPRGARRVDAVSSK